MPEFRIQSCLGRGGFGEVYKGVMSRGGGVEVDVAVKVLRPDLDPSSQGVQRLRDEGRLLGRLTHPTILRVYDLVVIDGRAALISEYVAGEDLAQLLKGEPIPARAAFEIIAQVAAALDAAWSWPSVTDGKPLHLVHRDIKPDNIRIEPHGVVKLLDFGIAQAQSVRREAHTSVNTIMGSTQYLAPERLVQQEVGPESDVFALGCTLFEALVGEALFARKSMRQMYLLMVDEGRFEEFVADRCASSRDRLGGDRAIALIRAMTAWRKQNRPSAAEVAARCDTISDSTPGPTLTQWCRARRWRPPELIPGPLDGRTFATSTQLVEPAAAPTRRPTSTPPRPFSDDPTLPPQEDRAPVLGELNFDALNTEEEHIKSSAEADQGPLPWSAAEMVALFGEAGPVETTRRIDRDELEAAQPGLPRRLPQLLRQRPPSDLAPEALTAALPATIVEEPTTTTAGPAVRAARPAFDADEPPARETGPTEVLPELLPSPAPEPVYDPDAQATAPLDPAVLAALDLAPVQDDPRHPITQPIPEDTGPTPVDHLPATFDPPTAPLDPQVLRDLDDPPTVRIPRRRPEDRALDETPAGPEPTLRGAALFEPTLEVPPVPAVVGPTSDSVDEVQRALGAEPVESDPGDRVVAPDEATDATGLPEARDLRATPTPAPPPVRSAAAPAVVAPPPPVEAEPTPVPVPAPATAVAAPVSPDEVQTVVEPVPAPTAPEPTPPAETAAPPTEAAPAEAPGTGHPAPSRGTATGGKPRKKRPAAPAFNPAVAVGASSVAGLLIGVPVLLLVLALLVFLMR